MSRNEDWDVGVAGWGYRCPSGSIGPFTVGTGNDLRISTVVKANVGDLKIGLRGTRKSWGQDLKKCPLGSRQTSRKLGPSCRRGIVVQPKAIVLCPNEQACKTARDYTLSLTSKGVNLKRA